MSCGQWSGCCLWKGSEATTEFTDGHGNGCDSNGRYHGPEEAQRSMRKENLWPMLCLPSTPLRASLVANHTFPGPQDPNPFVVIRVDSWPTPFRSRFQADYCGRIWDGSRTLISGLPW